MLKQLRQPIETSVGVIHGRDALFLNLIQSDIDDNRLLLEMDITGSLVSRLPDRSKDYLFFVNFSGVLAYRVIKLDSAYHLIDQSEEWSDYCASSFDEVVNSLWLAKLGGKITPQHKHYTVSTYDDIIDVVCEHFEMKVYQRITHPSP